MSDRTIKILAAVGFLWGIVGMWEYIDRIDPGGGWNTVRRDQLMVLLSLMVFWIFRRTAKPK